MICENLYVRGDDFSSNLAILELRIDTNIGHSKERYCRFQLVGDGVKIIKESIIPLQMLFDIPCAPIDQKIALDFLKRVELAADYLRVALPK